MVQTGQTLEPARLNPYRLKSLRNKLPFPVSSRVHVQLPKWKPSCQVAAPWKRQCEGPEGKGTQVPSPHGGWAVGCISTLLFGSLVWCGDVHAEIVSLGREDVSGPMRDRIEEIVLDEVSTRIHAMPDEELARILEDLLRPSNKNTETEFSSSKSNPSKKTTKTPARLERAPEEDQALSARPPLPEDTSPSTPFALPSAVDEGDRMDHIEVDTNPEEMMNPEISSPLTPSQGITVNEFIQKMRGLQAPTELVYSETDEVLVKFFSRFGEDPLRILKVAKAIAVGTSIIVPVLWGTQIFQWMMRPEDKSSVENGEEREEQAPADLIDNSEASPRVRSLVNEALSDVLDSGDEAQGKPLQKKFSLWPWSRNNNSEEDTPSDEDSSAEKEVNNSSDEPSSTSPPTTIPVDNVKNTDVHNSVEATENFSGTGKPLWVRNEGDTSFEAGDSMDDGNVLWRRDEFEDEIEQDSQGFSDKESFFVVEDAPSLPTISEAAWKPRVWTDPWLPATSIDGPSTFMTNSHSELYKSENGTDLPVDPITPHAISSSPEQQTGVGDAYEMEEKGGAHDQGGVWEPDKVEENLLSNVDTPNGLSAARIVGFVTRQSRTS